MSRYGAWRDARLAGLGRGLAARVHWVARETTDLSGRPPASSAWLVVLGREHYTERRQSYPVLSRRELGRVLDQELAGRPPTLRLIGPVVDSAREVALFEIKAEATQRCSAPFVFPESALLSRVAGPGVWAEIERQGYRYFLLPNGFSQPAGGALDQPRHVAFAAGLDPSHPPERWSTDSELLGRLRQGLRKVPAEWWLNGRNPVRRKGFQFQPAWRPLLALLGIGLVAYLAVTSGYLAGMLAWRGAALENLGPDVQVLLSRQARVEATANRVGALTELLGQRRATHRTWEVFSVASAAGANLDQVSFADDTLTLRGDAADAASVLGAVAALPGIEGVRFDAPVRVQRGGRQGFVISLRLPGEATDE